MKKIETIAVTKQQSYVITLQAIVMLFIGGAIFSTATSSNDLTTVGYGGIIVYVATIIVHELLHGITFRISGARPRFGVGIVGFIPIAYATSNSKVKVPNMLLVAYTPFVVLSVFFVCLARVSPQYQSLAMIGFLGNFTGAVGDLWIASKLWKYLPFKDALVLDKKSGIEVYSDNKAAITKGIKATKKAGTKSNFGKNWAISTLSIMFGQLLLPIFMTILGFNGNYRVGFGEFYLLDMVNKQGTEISATFNFLPALVIGLLLACVIKLSTNKRSRV